MPIRVTPSARSELLETVVRIRHSSRPAAARFVAEVEARLRAVAEDTDATPELRSPWRSASASAGHRLYVRVRGDTLWLLAVWPQRN